MKKVFIQLWSWEGNPAGASLHINEQGFKKWSKSNSEMNFNGELTEIEISKSLFFELLYNDGILELKQNSLSNLISLGEIKIEENWNVA
jgi:hypothetical protein